MLNQNDIRKISTFSFRESIIKEADPEKIIQGLRKLSTSLIPTFIKETETEEKKVNILLKRN